MIDDILDFQFLEMCSSLQLLDACTDKLGLVSAARKLFLSDGTPVTHPRQLSRDVDVYVSCEEAFRDPYASILGSDKLFIPLKFKIFLELERSKTIYTRPIFGCHEPTPETLYEKKRNSNENEFFCKQTRKLFSSLILGNLRLCFFHCFKSEALDNS